MTDKDLCIETEEIQTDGKDTYYCHRYEPTPYEVLDELFTFYTPEKTDVFVDYGCGMGRLNFYIEKSIHLFIMKKLWKTKKHITETKTRYTS